MKFLYDVVTITGQRREMRVPIRELKAGLSRFLAQALAGEVIEVTSHDRPVARIVGIPRQESDRLAQSMASGKVAWSGRKPELDEPLALSPEGRPVSRMVLEDRR